MLRKERGREREKKINKKEKEGKETWREIIKRDKIAGNKLTGHKWRCSKWKDMKCLAGEEKKRGKKIIMKPGKYADKRWCWRGSKKIRAKTSSWDKNKTNIKQTTEYESDGDKDGGRRQEQNKKAKKGKWRKGNDDNKLNW